MKWEKVRCLRGWAEPGSPPGLTPPLTSTSQGPCLVPAVTLRPLQTPAWPHGPLLPTSPPLGLLSAGNKERWAGPTPQQTLRVSANSRVQWEPSCLHIHGSCSTEQGRDSALLPGKQLALGAVAWKGSLAWPGGTMC